MRKNRLKAEQLFFVKVLVKNGCRPFFYWDKKQLEAYEHEVVVLVVGLLKKRTEIYLGLKKEGLDLDLEGNPIKEFFDNLLTELNAKETPQNSGWNLFVNSLLNSVPNQPLSSWVGSDKELIENVQSVWDSINNR